MSTGDGHIPTAPPPPRARITLAVTGHRDSNAAFAARRAAIEQTLAAVFDAADDATARHGAAPARLFSPLAPGADLIAAAQALARGWELIAPLPFGLATNIAINIADQDPAEARALLDGASPAERDGVAGEIATAAARACTLQLTDDDALIDDLLRQVLDDPAARPAATHLATLSSERAAAASRIVVEQADLLVAVWDGVTPGAVGGTRHTMALALSLGVPVLWLDAAAGDRLALLRLAEDLVDATADDRRIDAAGVATLFDATLAAATVGGGGEAQAFARAKWHARSPRLFAAYRWIEDLFGGQPGPRRHPGRSQRYEPPDAIATGSAAPLIAVMRALPGVDAGLVDRIEREVIARFAWADGISTRLSDLYRGGMVLNFLLSAAAIIGGSAYLPLTDGAMKWPFALTEFVLLLAIVGITATGRRRAWHGRWFQTRRVAEYLRHAPLLLLTGAARPPGAWPRGKDNAWPEVYARGVIAGVGLPAMTMGQPYLAAVLSDVVLAHVAAQARYHRQKAAKLRHVQHGLDRVSDLSFKLAIVSVAAYLALESIAVLHLAPEALPHALSKVFTFLGVLFPTIGGAIAGIRYFGDFERFAAISDATAAKLDNIQARADRLLKGPVADLQFARVSALTAALDDVVISEIESWQSVFVHKTITVPV